MKNYILIFVFITFLLSACMDDTLTGNNNTEFQDSLKSDIYFLSNEDSVYNWDNRDYDLYCINADGTNIRKLLDLPIGDFDLSPDKKMISCYSENGIYIQSLDGSNPNVIPTNGYIYHRSWSPDNQYIGYVAKRSEGKSELSIAKPDGSNKNIISDSDTIKAFAWSPDSKKIVYSSEDGITEVNTDGGEKKIIMPKDKFHFINGNMNRLISLKYSPQGDKIIIYSLFFDFKEQALLIMDSDGSNLRSLVKGHYEIGDWSRDGTKILLHDAVGNSPGDIYQINHNGTGFINLTNTSNQREYSPQFSSDENQIIFDVDSINPRIGIMQFDASNKRILTPANRIAVNPRWAK